jgi:hypothetical protein
MELSDHIAEDRLNPIVVRERVPTPSLARQQGKPFPQVRRSAPKVIKTPLQLRWRKITQHSRGEVDSYGPND